MAALRGRAAESASSAPAAAVADAGEVSDECDEDDTAQEEERRAFACAAAAALEEARTRVARADAALTAASEASTRLAEYFGEDLPKAHTPSAASPGAGAPSVAPAGGMSALLASLLELGRRLTTARDALEARRSASDAARGRAGSITTGPEHAPAVGALRVGERVATAFGRGVIEAIRPHDTVLVLRLDGFGASGARAFFQPSALIL